MYAFYLFLFVVVCSEAEITVNQQIGSELYNIYSEEIAPECIKSVMQELNSSCSDITTDTIELLAASIVYCENPKTPDCSNSSVRKGQSITRCAISSSENLALSLGKYVYQINMLCEFSPTKIFLPSISY